jgi:acetyl-CoA carboxylase biotin carboxylase subunit
MPSPGTVDQYYPPGGFGIRIDSHLFQGYDLPIYYDSLIAKLISFASSRHEAVQVMKRALEEYIIKPIKTTIPLYREVMEDSDFLKGEFDTGYIAKFLPDDEDD